MLISGLQKLTLLDYPGKVACTLFTSGCNFRCPFCHNASLVLPELAGQCDGAISEDELLLFLRKRQGVLDGVAVTGGEPLLHKELPALLEKIRALGFMVKLDTNGSFPERLKDVVSAGLVDRVAMDIKNSPELYEKTVGISGLELGAIERSKDFLLSGKIDYEFRTTVVRGLHTRESIVGAAQWIAGAKKYYLQQFKDSGQIIAIDGLSAYDEKEMHSLAEAAAQYVPSVQVRGV